VTLYAPYVLPDKAEFAGSRAWLVGRVGLEPTTGVWEMARPVSISIYPVDPKDPQAGKQPRLSWHRPWLCTGARPTRDGAPGARPTEQGGMDQPGTGRRADQDDGQREQGQR